MKAAKGLQAGRLKSLGIKTKKPTTQNKVAGAMNRFTQASRLPKVANAVTNAAKTIGSDVKKVLPKFKKGGMVKKTGPAIVHKGERVLNKKQTTKFNSKKYEATRKSVFGLGKK